MDANTLRRAFTAFFEERGHTSVDSASLIPHHPSAPLFTNSGMMQFVPYFLGEESAPWPRATSIQKCVRLSGKHNDLGELGRTRRHLTFFEMLGNWSFGDYFKEDAIGWAWALLTEHVGFDGDRLWVTVHVDDDEAEAIWHEGVGLPLERIQRLDKENFWEMGPTGPCGPDSEIHFDCGPEWGEEGGPAGGGDDRYIEFWNLVFMSYFRHTDGTLTDLPRHNIDTGGGLERWLMLLQGVPTVFDTDAVRPLIEVAESLSGTTYGADDRSDVALRVVADHARSMAFLVGDGVVPSNEDRGYVVRSVIRRAVTRGQQLGVDRPFLGALVRRTIELLGGAYPELTSGADVVVDTIEREEHRFRQTLATGSALLDVELARGAVAGEVAFKLHDTYGFPIEVTEEMAAERGVAVDRAGFDAAMATQRARGKESRRGGEADLPVEVYRRLAERAGATEFTGREEHETKARVLEVVQAGDGHLEIFLDRTPFYAESGGQVGDTGTITTDTGRAEVLDTTYALPGLHRHVARVVEGEILEGQEAVATIDDERRQAIRRNHTGTHLLHWALRQVLGDHVKQQGSLVGPDYLRFDFSHHAPTSSEELAAIEDLANAEVLANDPVRHYETTKAQAVEAGAIAFFGDKYGEIVRVLEAGRHSVELCGGTHVSALGDIGPIRITSESSIGANQRRIFATTGTGTLERVRRDREQLARAAGLLAVPPDEVVDGLERLREELKDLRDQLKAAQRAAAGAGAAELAARAVDGVVVARRDAVGRDELKDLAVAVRQQPGVRAVVLGGSPPGGGVALVAAVTPDSGLVASALIADAARTVGGGGGKAADLAVAGGRDPSRLDQALDQARAAALTHAAQDA
ncbi:MAG: alanine--tRNA ligase [Actinomycetota bacterium]|nr:alanine--tRNA ligase [Actinomycetota bacterium]